MTFGNRKKAKVISFTHDPTKEETSIFLNNRPLKYFLQCTLGSPALEELVKLSKGQFNITCIGGGVGSQVQLIEKVLFNTLEESQKLNIKQRYPSVDRTDGRRRYPKIYGGRKSRARSQKSYR